MGSKEYGIIIDTNCLGSYNKGSLESNNLNYLSINKPIFFSLIKFLKDNGLTKNMKILIPKIVFEELKEQQKRLYFAEKEKLKEKFSKFSALEGFKIEIPNLDYETHLNKKIDSFVSKYGITILDYPSNKVLPKLIQKVLSKEKPFYKKNNDIDSGFKDALIWESILEYAEKNIGLNLMFLSTDSDFKDNKLLSEFSKVLGKKITIYNCLSDLKIEINNKIKLNLDFDHIVGTFRRKLFDQLCKFFSAHYFEIDIGGLYKVLNFQFVGDISDINKIKDNKYEVIIYADITHETPYTEFGIVDELFTHYEKESTVEMIRIIVEKVNEKVLIESIEFDNLRLNGNKIVKMQY